MTDKRHRSQADDRPKPEPDIAPGTVAGATTEEDVARERARRRRMPSDDELARRSRVSKTDPEDDRRE